jgi:hypothetical protein
MTMLVVKKTSLGYIITMRIWNQGTIRWETPTTSAECSRV